MAVAPAFDSNTGRYNDTLRDQRSETIFLRFRDRLAGAFDKLNSVVDDIRNFAGRARIQQIGIREEANESIDQLFALKHRLINAYITIGCQNNSDNIWAILYEKIFFSVKTSVGLELGYKKIADSIILDKLLRKKFLLADAASSVREAFTVACETDEERRQFLRDLLNEIETPEQDETAREIAAQVTERWASKPGRVPKGESRENPAQFVRRVYAPWLAEGRLERIHLRSDLALYNAYAGWIGRHPEDDLGLRAEPRPRTAADNETPEQRAAREKEQARQRSARFKTQNTQISISLPKRLL